MAAPGKLGVWRHVRRQMQEDRVQAFSTSIPSWSFDSAYARDFMRGPSREEPPPFPAGTPNAMLLCCAIKNGLLSRLRRGSFRMLPYTNSSWLVLRHKVGGNPPTTGGTRRAVENHDSGTSSRHAERPLGSVLNQRAANCTPAAWRSHRMRCLPGQSLPAEQARRTGGDTTSATF